MRRAGLGAAALVVALTGCASEPPRPPAPAHYNLVLITLDTVRADHLGCYGYSKPTSPVLDMLASRSVLFEEASAQSAITPVSHASILTGRDPYHHSLRSMHGGRDYALPDDEITLAEILRANGYATGGFVSAFPVTRHYGLHQGFEFWDEAFEGSGGRGAINERGIVNTGRAQRRGDGTTLRAQAWIRERADRRFFAWIHYFDAHDRLVQPPQAYLARFMARREPGEDGRITLYDAEIYFVDEQVGRILRLLVGLGIREKTIVAVVADHGEGLGDHDWWWHAILYREQLRVPFILSVPGRGWTGRIPRLVRTIDLVPTLVDVMGLECPRGGCDFDGRSLRPLLDGEDDSPRLAYSESLNDLAAYYRSPWREDSLYAVNDGRWKLIVRRQGAIEKPPTLFDLREDPGELVNVARDHPEAAARLRAYLEGLGAMVEERRTPALDPETRARLGSLGYVR
ncbi:MAG: sulfatase [Acidobacteriota bacterium]